MHSVRLVCFILGFWLAGGLFMAWVATENFRGVDRLLEQAAPVAHLQFQALDDPKAAGPGAARQLLRYQVSEQNRLYFECWEIAQLMLGGILFFFVLFATRENKFSLAAVLLMIVLVAVQRFVLTPQLTAIGRNLDFAGPASSTLATSQFWSYHNAYSAMEIFKWLLTVGLAVRLIAGRRHRRSSTDLGQQLDMIHKADHRHIDR
jgi:hypothetical protein